MNKYNSGIAVKIAASLATIFIFWDLKWVLALPVLALCYVVTAHTAILRLELCTYLARLVDMSNYHAGGSFTQCGRRSRGWWAMWTRANPAMTCFMVSQQEKPAVPHQCNCCRQGKSCWQAMPLCLLRAHSHSAMLALCRMVFPLIA